MLKLRDVLNIYLFFCTNFSFFVIFWPWISFMKIVYPFNVYAQFSLGRDLEYLKLTTNVLSMVVADHQLAAAFRRGTRPHSRVASNQLKSYRVHNSKHTYSRNVPTFYCGCSWLIRFLITNSPPLNIKLARSL